MTTFYKFTPNAFKAPSFMPTFDGIQYKITIIWNVSSLRFYVLCQTIDGTLIFLLPLIESSIALEISNLEYDSYNTRVIVTTTNPHNFPIGQIVNMKLRDAAPSGFNGHGPASVLNANQITYNLPVNPGQPTVFGVIEFLISMTQGYFLSTLVYRNGMFEVNP